MYKLGTLKLTWISPNDFTILESQMYDSDELEKALREAESKPDWMLFQLMSTKDDGYQWKLLPYGTYKSFVRSMKWRKSDWTPFILIAGIGLGAYLILDKISQLAGGK
jgi:hypothetical protein